MSDLGNVIAYAISMSQGMVDRFVADLSAGDYLHRPTPKANCAAWTLGHLISTDRRILGRLGVKELPPVPDDFEKRFARDEHAPASSDYGDVSNLRALWKSHRDLLVATARSLPDAELTRPVDPPHPRFNTTGEMLQFMAIHAMLHAGQLSTIRRSLGMPPLI